MTTKGKDDGDAEELGILRTMIREELGSVLDEKIAEHTPAPDDKGTTADSRSGSAAPVGFMKRLFTIEPASK